MHVKAGLTKVINDHWWVLLICLTQGALRHNLIEHACN
jgi:hypothetical protein